MGVFCGLRETGGALVPTTCLTLMSVANGDSKPASSLTQSLSFLIMAGKQGSLSKYCFGKLHSSCTWPKLPLQRSLGFPVSLYCCFLVLGDQSPGELPIYVGFDSGLMKFLGQTILASM